MDGWDVLAARAREVEAERLDNRWWRSDPKPKPGAGAASTHEQIDWGDTEIDFARRRRELVAAAKEYDDMRQVGG